MGILSSGNSCGCDNGCSSGLCGNSSCGCLILLLLLFGCGNNGLFGSSSCGCGNNDSCLWIILLLLFCGGSCGSGSSCGCNSSSSCGC